MTRSEPCLLATVLRACCTFPIEALFIETLLLETYSCALSDGLRSRTLACQERRQPSKTLYECVSIFVLACEWFILVLISDINVMTSCPHSLSRFNSGLLPIERRTACSAMGCAWGAWREEVLTSIRLLELWNPSLRYIFDLLVFNMIINVIKNTILTLHFVLARNKSNFALVCDF